jgi:hypothetical protein
MQPYDHKVIGTNKGRSLTTLIKLCPSLTTYLPLADIGEGISLLLEVNIRIPFTFLVPPTYLVPTSSCQHNLWTTTYQNWCCIFVKLRSSPQRIAKEVTNLTVSFSRQEKDIFNLGSSLTWCYLTIPLTFD